MTLKSGRPALASERKDSPEAREHKVAFDDYVRHGESANLRALEVKAMSVGSNPDGGYTVPFETEKTIGERLTLISPIRGIAGVRQISANIYKKPFMTAGPAAGWVGETDVRAQTASATLAELQFPAMELYAQPAATATLLEDSAVNIDEWLAGEVEQVFATQEGAAFVNGGPFFYEGSANRVVGPKPYALISRPQRFAASKLYGARFESSSATPNSGPPLARGCSAGRHPHANDVAFHLHRTNRRPGIMGETMEYNVFKAEAGERLGVSERVARCHILNNEALTLAEDARPNEAAAYRALARGWMKLADAIASPD